MHPISILLILISQTRSIRLRDAQTSFTNHWFNCPPRHVFHQTAARPGFFGIPATFTTNPAAALIEQEKGRTLVDHLSIMTYHFFLDLSLLLSVLPPQHYAYRQSAPPRRSCKWTPRGKHLIFLPLCFSKYIILELCPVPRLALRFLSLSMAFIHPRRIDLA